MTKKRQTKKPKDVLFTDRVLMTLATEVDDLTETAARIRAQMKALAAERGIVIP